MNAPVFGKTPPTFRIKNREFVADITSSTAFSTANYTINPGNSNLFPWLHSMAAGYQQYKVNGMVMYFNTTSATAIGSTNTAMGTIMMSTNYDLAEPNYSTKSEVLASYFSSSGAPSQDLIHAIECDPKQRPVDIMYVDQAGESVTDPALFNMGNFQVATAGMQAASVIGELWVSYDITFYKPRLSSNSLFTIIQNGPWDANYPTGILQTEQLGTQLHITGAGTGSVAYDLTPYAGKLIYVMLVNWGTSLTGGTLGYSLSGCAEGLYFKQGTVGLTSAITSTTRTIDGVYINVPVNGDTPSITWSASLSSGTPTYSDLMIVALTSINQV
jgi:hypothetical protein